MFTSQSNLQVGQNILTLNRTGFYEESMFYIPAKISQNYCIFHSLSDIKVPNLEFHKTLKEFCQQFNIFSNFQAGQAKQILLVQKTRKKCRPMTPTITSSI